MLTTQMSLNECYPSTCFLGRPSTWRWQLTASEDIPRSQDKTTTFSPQRLRITQAYSTLNCCILLKLFHQHSRVINILQQTRFILHHSYQHTIKNKRKCNVSCSIINLLSSFMSKNTTFRSVSYGQRAPTMNRDQGYRLPSTVKLSCRNLRQHT